VEDIPKTDKSYCNRIGILDLYCKKWFLYYREPGAIFEWLAQVGYKDISTEVDPWGMYVYYRARR